MAVVLWVASVQVRVVHHIEMHRRGSEVKASQVAKRVMESTGRSEGWVYHMNPAGAMAIN